MFCIERLEALEILDSRGRPTLRATCRLASGASGSASVPSGASRGHAEAVELRDGTAGRYAGLGCRRAVEKVGSVLHEALSGRPLANQAELDHLMIELDGTPDKHVLGANSILAVSLAFARACACQQGLPLYRYIAQLVGRTAARLPRLTVNLLSGGLHAGGQVSVQDILVIPQDRTIHESLATVASVYDAGVRLVAQRYGMRHLKADEGGLAPPADSSEAMIVHAMESIHGAGLTPGQDVTLGIDLAATHFFVPATGRYLLDGQDLPPAEMIDRVQDWVRRFPITSVEDPLAEDDWNHWPAVRAAISPQAILLGDDLLCTNAARIQRAIELGACNALLLKVNQVGTLTESFESWRLATDAGWQVTVSARSGETEDDWLADLAVGLGSDAIKIGSINQSDRLAKYNRLLAIEAELVGLIPVDGSTGLIERPG